MSYGIYSSMEYSSMTYGMVNDKTKVYHKENNTVLNTVLRPNSTDL